MVGWRGYGGAARGWRFRAALLPFPTVTKNSSSSLLLRFFRSQWLPILGSVLVLFRFPSSRFVSVLLSLSGLTSLLSLSSVPLYL